MSRRANAVLQMYQHEREVRCFTRSFLGWETLLDEEGRPAVIGDSLAPLNKDRYEQSRVVKAAAKMAIGALE